LEFSSLYNSGKIDQYGNDFILWNNGSVKDSTLSDWPSSDSNTQIKLWAEMSFHEEQVGYIDLTGMSDSVVTTLTYQSNSYSLSFLHFLYNADHPAFRLESEVIKYNRDYIDFENFRITNLTRGANNTTAVSHSGNQGTLHIPNDLWLVYSDSDGLTAREGEDNYFPTFDWWDSDVSNTFWRWTDQLAYMETNYDLSAWFPIVNSTKSGLSHFYSDSADTYYPYAYKAGMSLNNPPDFRIANEIGEVSWEASHPYGFSSVTYQGKMYSLSGSWPGLHNFQYLEPALGWVTVADSDIVHNDSDNGSWISFGPSTHSFSGVTGPSYKPYKHVRFILSGQLNSTINDTAKIEFEQVALVSTWLTGQDHEICSEQSINFLNFTLYNETTGENIQCSAPCPIGSSLIIDCENKLAYMDDGSIVNITLSSNRKSWLDLVPGANVIKFVDSGTAGNTITVNYRNRIL
jgi:hypothetical protein